MITVTGHLHEPVRYGIRGRNEAALTFRVHADGQLFEAHVLRGTDPEHHAAAAREAERYGTPGTPATLQGRGLVFIGDHGELRFVVTIPVSLQVGVRPVQL